ncbi:MAG TPA: hypothetical protein EYP85_10985 [Armatimonadetes bacterium]|nr:hypothetical protein [Armatimonadota bacterium]
MDAYTALLLGEQPEISAKLFGLTAFEGFPSVIADRDYRARVAALRPGCIRLAGNLAWCAPPEYDPTWYETSQAARVFSQVLLFGARYPTGRFLPVVRQLGAEPMCSLGAPPPYLTQEGTRHPSDFDRWARYCAAYIGLWKKFDPDFRLVQIWNEPNATWFRDPRARAKGAAALHIQMANKVARAIKQFPDLRVGGPVLCWPPAWPPAQRGKRPWYTWEEWTLPWLRDTKDTVDFFDFHAYNVSPGDFAVQTEMLFNQALLTQGRRLPIWITESNMHLRPEELDDPRAIWRKRILPYERLLLRGMLPQADKVEGNLYHDLHAKHHTLLPGSAEQPNPTYWLLWILRDLRGRRIVADSADSDLLAYATLEEDRVSIVLFNDCDSPRDVHLKVSLPCGYWTGPRVRAIGEGPKGGCQRIQVRAAFERQRNRAEGLVSLPAYATVSLNFRLDNFPTPPRVRLIREYFGDRTLQFLQGEKPIAVEISVPKVERAKVYLRVGLLGPEGTESLGARFNGNDLPLKATAIQDLPLEPAALQPKNRLEVWLREPAANPRLALGFASVVVETTR